jgi:hypothetical protein
MSVATTGRGRPRKVSLATAALIVVMVRDGASWSTVAGRLNADGVPTPDETDVAPEERTHEWTKLNVRNVLHATYIRRLVTAADPVAEAAAM